MAVEQTSTSERNGAAAGLMLAAVIGYSLIPLLVALSNGKDSPFLFNAGLTLGVGIGQAAFLWVFFRRVLFTPSVLQLVWRKIFSYSMFLIVVHRFEYGLFAWATGFIDVSVASAIFEIWPITSLLLMAYLFRNEGRYRKITFGKMLLLGLAFVGFLFVASSDTGEFLNWKSAGFLETGKGLILVLLAVLVASFVAFTFRWGEDFRRELPQDVLDRESDRIVEISCVMLASCIGALISAALNLGVGVGIGEQFSIYAAVASVVGGALSYGVANITYRTAIVLTVDLGINAMLYATPLLALFWLFIFNQADVARPELLIIGAAVVIIANLLINFEAEVRFGFKALILSLWACGAFVYLREELLVLLPFGGWLWPRETYLGALGFSATIFILLLSFRVARIAPRTQNEDNRIFALHRNLELLVRRRLIAPEAAEHIRGIDGARNVEELRRAYTQTKLCFAQATAVDLPAADLRLLADAEAQLNMVAHSRQQGVDFGELFALIIFGGSTVLLSLLSRPEVGGWTAFIYDVFAALFPAVIIFLIVSVWDLHRDRADLVLATRTGPEGYGVIFRDPRSRRFERGISVVVGLLIIVVYALLLWQKWLN